MTDIVGSDIPQGNEVRWYAGGAAVTETHTVTAGEVSAAGFALSTSAVAEYGSVVGTVDGVFTAILEKKTNKDTAATEATGCDFVGYTGITEGDVVVLRYVDTHTTALTHIASCQDVGCDSSAEKKTAAIHGQANKITSIGAVENTATLTELEYSLAFVAACQGNYVSGTPIAGATVGKWTNAFTGMNKIGALVGKRVNSAGTVTEKWFLIGCQAEKQSAKFPTNDFYSKDFSFAVDYFTTADLTA